MLKKLNSFYGGVYPRNSINSNPLLNSYTSTHKYKSSKSLSKSPKSLINQKKNIICDTNNILNEYQNRKLEEPLNRSYGNKFNPNLCDSEYFKNAYIKEREKNEQYLLLIKDLEKKNEDLQNSLYNKQVKYLNDLTTENNKLKQFQNKVYSYSKKYDEINENILQILRVIDDTIQMLDDTKKNYNFNYKYNSIVSCQQNLKDVINEMTKFLANKQDEFNYLLNVKDEEIAKINQEKSELKKNYDDALKKNEELKPSKDDINLINRKIEEIKNIRSNNNNSLYNSMIFNQKYTFIPKTQYNGLAKSQLQKIKMNSLKRKIKDLLK